LGEQHGRQIGNCLKAFVPAKDSALSRQFYLDLGFTQLWRMMKLRSFKSAHFDFYFRLSTLKKHAGNFMMSMAVEDADAWWKHITDIDLPGKYPGIVAKPPTTQPWGLRVLYLSDPTGVLWHIGRQTPRINISFEDW